MREKCMEIKGCFRSLITPDGKKSPSSAPDDDSLQSHLLNATDRVNLYLHHTTGHALPSLMQSLAKKKRKKKTIYQLLPLSPLFKILRQMALSPTSYTLTMLHLQGDISPRYDLPLLFAFQCWFLLQTALICSMAMILQIATSLNLELGHWIK